MKRRQSARAPSDAAALRSAGGVLVRRDADGLRVAVMRSAYGTWVFPKGGIEAGERPEQTAAREMGEEIGVSKAALLADLGQTEHEYEQSGQTRRKQVEWFLFEAPPEAELSPNANQGCLDCGWFSPQQALLLLSHADHRRLLRRALSLLRRVSKE